MTKRRALLLALLLSPAALRAAEPPRRVFTLEDSQRIALLNDARLLSAEQDKIIASERVREAQFLFLPELGLQASATKYEARYPFSLSGEARNILLFPDLPNIYGPNTGNIYSGRGYMYLSLYEGRRTINTLRLAQAAQKQALSNYDSVRMDLLLSVKEAFFRLILAQEKLAASEKFLRTAEDLLGVARMDQWERLEAESHLGEARVRASDARHALDLTRLSFLKILNIEFDTPFTVEGSLDTAPAQIELDKISLWAMELRPELQSETYKAQMDAIAVNLASARRIPTLFLAGDYELTGLEFPLRQNNWDATVGIKIPFSYDYWSQIKQKRAEQRQGQLKRAELQDRVRLEVRQAYDTLQHWQREYPVREAQFRRAQGFFELASRTPGAALAKIRALSGLLDLRLSYLGSVMEHILAEARLERAVGRALAP